MKKEQARAEVLCKALGPKALPLCTFRSRLSSQGAILIYIQASSRSPFLHCKGQACATS